MTVLRAEQGVLPEDPQALRLQLFEVYKPADSDDVEVLGSVVEAYVAWRRVGQMAWGTAEVWQ